MYENLEENKKNEEILHVLKILEQEFEVCIKSGNMHIEDKTEKRTEHNTNYYEKLKKERGLDVFINEYSTSLYLSKKYNIDHNKLMGIIKKLETLYYIINIIKNYNTYNLTTEGKNYLLEGSPEYISLNFVKKQNECSMEDIKKCLGKKGEIGISLNLKTKLVQLNKETKTLTIHLATEEDFKEDKTKSILDIIQKNGNDEEELFCNLQKWMDQQKEYAHKGADRCNTLLQELKKRKMIEIKKNTYSYIVKTSEFNTEVKKHITDLTHALLKNSEYEKYAVKKYNFFSSGKKINKGNFHLLSKQMKTFKEIFISLGFEEMQTNKYVESSFWCFDALYIPQQHPSRDLQDTFFIKYPELSPDNFTESTYIENVKTTHSKGNYDSFGWNYTWNIEETKRNVLRTHTTATSARILYQLAKKCKQEGCEIPMKKYFSIDKVFRNENLDSTHLAEFHQVEGLILGKNLGLGHLKGVLSAFYKKIGITKLKFKPTFNPYTEPSMEVYGFHELHKKWLEVGNSGIFRPELLRPMGFPKDVSVIAWGLSLERPTMIKYNIKNIRDLVGYKSVI